MMFMRLLVCAAMLFFCGFQFAQAQENQKAPVYHDLPLRTQGALEVFVETANFRGTEGMTRLEIYSLLDARQLQFVPEGGKFVSQVDFTAVLRDSMGKEIKRELWTRNVTVTDMQMVKNQGALVRDLASLDVPPGKYQFAFTAEDIYGDHSGTCEGHVLARNFAQTELAVSDVMFASELIPTTETGRFVKNNWQITPNTTRFVRTGDSLRVYFEIYHLKIQPDKPNDSFVLGYSLIDTGDVAVKTYPAKRLLKPGESVAKTEMLDTQGLSGGVYRLQVDLFDRSTREHVRYRRPVFLISEEQEMSKLTEAEEAQLRYFRNIEIVATEKELAIFEKLKTNDEQMKFLKVFWLKLDPTPGTPLNERLRDHMMRLQYADENFTSEPGKRGSDTDKGRVYIKYGPPDERDYTTSAAGGKAIDTWIYEKSGRYIFVFFDRRGTGIYELVHSTMSGEVYNPEWQRTAF